MKINKQKGPKQIKFVKYEYNKPNDLWYTNLTICPYTGKQLIAFISDYSMFIVHAELYYSATIENIINAFKEAIRKYGKPKRILIVNGTQFTNPHNRDDKNHEFTKFCEKNKIKHILGRVHYPQTIKNILFLEVYS